MNIINHLNYKIKLFLSLLLGITLFILYYNYNPTENHSIFPECPIHKFTGLYCTGCGSQRTIHYLLHGEIYKALHYNPMIVLLSPFLIYLIGISLYNFIFNKKIRINILYNNKFIIIFFSLLLIYTIARNIPYKPFIYLAPYSGKL